MIHLTGVHKTFSTPQGPKEVLCGVDLSIAQGEICGIVGESGAGKSTLLRMLNALERPTFGHISVMGVAVPSLKGEALRTFRRSVSMVFQGFNLLDSLTCLDNVALPLRFAGLHKAEARHRAGLWFESVGLRGCEDSMPSRLSGGQKQRVAIARALAGGAKLLLSDEATSALDPQTTEQVLDLLAQLNRQLGLTIVLITHQMEVVRRICNTVAVMENGRIVEHGTVRSVFAYPQSRLAKRFLGALPRQDGIHLPKEPGCPVITLVFDGEGAQKPALFDAALRSDVRVNILNGRIDELYRSRVGRLTVQLIGRADNFRQMCALLTEQGIGVEVEYAG